MPPSVYTASSSQCAKAAQVAVELLLTHSSRVWKIISYRGQMDIGIMHPYHGNYKSISMLLQKEGNQRWAGPAVGCTLGTCSLLQSPREAGGDLPGLMRLLIERCAAKLQVAMKLLGAQLSSILSLGEKGQGVRCLRGARSRSSSSQNTLSMSAENHHCTVAHCGLRRQQGAQFLQWHLVSPLHTCEAGMMRTMLAEPSLLSPPAH